MRRLTVGIASFALFAMSMGTTQVARAGEPPATIDPRNFTHVVDNPWFPLKPGVTRVYAGVRDGKAARDVFYVTGRSRVINGVRCTVVRDLYYLDGKLHERTRDYFAQHKDGTVWYFGEDTAELDENGKVISREGTWHAGVDGAIAGVFMEARPGVGHTFHQEFYKGHAEDQYRVLSLTGAVETPIGWFTNVQVTKEWTRLEPGVFSHKYYVHGLGQVAEKNVTGGDEHLDLVSISSE